MRLHAPFPRLLALALVLGPAACVKKSTHELTLADLAEARRESQDLRSELEQRTEEEADLRARMEEGERARAETEEEARARIAELRADSADLDTRRRRAVDRFDQARSEVDRLETLLDQRGSEYRRLQDRLEALSAIEQEVRERNRIYEEVIGRFRSLIDGGRLSVSIVRGRMVIHLPQDILFESGSAVIGRDGRQTLTEVAGVLAELSDRRFQVEGHTDNVPISTERFPSNWELSSARALSVVRLLIGGGVSPENVSGAGYGEYQPVASNDDPESRRLNRRIEIVMLPNLDVIAESDGPG